MRPRRGALPQTATWAALVAAVCCACSSSSSADPVEVIDFDLPTVIQLGGGSLHDPRVQPIYFPGFPYASDMDTFFQRLATSTYWPAVVGEYHVRDLTVLPGYTTNVVLPTTLSVDALRGLVAQALTEGSATLGALRADTIYAIFLSPASTLTMEGQTYCGDGAPTADHADWLLTTLSQTPVPVAYFATCPASGASGSSAGVDALTPTVSREIVEAATDPFPYSKAAYGAIDAPHILWPVAMNEGMSFAEVGDLCEHERPNLITPPDIGHPVQRIWSNRSAKAGTGPCVPVPPGEIYFNAVAGMPIHAPYYDRLGTAYSVPAIAAEDGMPLSVQISFRGPMTTSPFTAAAFELDAAGSLDVDQPTALMGAPGQTIEAPVATSAAMKRGLTPLVIRATDAAHTAVHFWVGGIYRN